jgi:aarF domain-containing kinase
LPSLYIEKLRKLEDAVPHLLDETQVQEKICQELKLTKLSEAFSYFDPKPIGSASIGQVHYGILNDRNKTKVAIKVQSPGAEELFRKDVKVARDFCRVFAPEQVIIFDEIEKQFLTEFDYAVEADRLQKVKDNMKEFSKLVVVPQPYKKLCSREILTMQFLDGSKLIDGAREKGKEYAATLGMTIDELESQMRATFDKEGLPPPYDGPGPFVFELYRKSLVTKDAILNAPIYLTNNLLLGPIRWTFRNVLGLKSVAAASSLSDFKYHKSFIPLNSSHIMDTLLKVHGTQLLRDGYFNADCHPGNFLLLRDGRIGLIDYGQVKELSKQDRIVLAEMIVALANKDKDRVYQISMDTGFRTKFNNKDVIYNMTTISLDQDGRQVTQGLNIQQFMDTQFEKDPWSRTNDMVIMPMRMSLLLRGVGVMLGHPVSTARAWKPIAEEVLRKEGGLYDKKSGKTKWEFEVIPYE